MLDRIIAAIDPSREPFSQTGETVTVVSDTSLINYENPILEGGVTPETLRSFPLTVNGAPRSSVAVAIMMPGVTTGGATAIEGFMNQSGMVSLQTDFGTSPDSTSEVTPLPASKYATRSIKQ